MEVLQKVGKAAGFLFTSCKHCTILHLQALQQRLACRRCMCARVPTLQDAIPPVNDPQLVHVGQC